MRFWTSISSFCAEQFKTSWALKEENEAFLVKSEDDFMHHIKYQRSGMLSPLFSTVGLADFLPKNEIFRFFNILKAPLVSKIGEPSTRHLSSRMQGFVGRIY